MSLMIKSMKTTGFASLITGALLISIFLAPFNLSQNPDKESYGSPPGWSDDINISNRTAQEKYPAIAISGDQIHIVWMYNYVDLRYIKSNDGGKTWEPFTTLYHSNEMVLYPDIKVSGQNVHTVWQDINGVDGIYYRNSNDGGSTWCQIKRITPNISGYDAICPKIFVNNSTIHIIWLDRRDGSNGQIYYRRSLDGGLTFDNGQGVDVDRRLTFSSALLGSPSISGAGSNISILWTDQSDGDFDVYWMISKDNGFTWEDGLGTPNVGRKLSDDTTDSDKGTVAVNSSTIHVTWVDQKWPGPEYRIYYRNSIDNGVTWNLRQLLTGPSPLIASPDINALVDNICIVWDDARDDGTTTEIYYKNSSDKGITWNGDTRLTNSTGYDSLWPRIAVNDTTKHVTWWDIRDGNREIYYKRSPDFPDISPPVHSNEMPPPDSYKDPPGTTVSVSVTDPSGVNATSIKLYVNGSLVTPGLTPITGGYNVSYVSPGYESGVIACRIVANDTFGNHLDYTWTFTVLNSFRIPVVAGWNLISMPLLQPNSNLPSVIQDRDGDTQWDRAMSYNASDAIDHWKQYNMGWSASLNDLKGVNNRIGLWLNVTNVGDGFLNVTGLQSTSTQISLRAGWNLVGYPTLSTDMNAGNAFWGTGADIVEVFDQSTTYRTRVVGPSYVMKPGEAYWVHVPADSIWTVNW